MATFEELYRQHVQAVFRFALSVVGKREVAEDLTSEAFLALHRNLAAIDQGQLPGWLLTVVRNRARDWWRRQMVERRYAEQFVAAPEPEAPPVEQLDARERGSQTGAPGLSGAALCAGDDTGGNRRAHRVERDAGQGTSAYALTLLRKAHGVQET